MTLEVHSGGMQMVFPISISVIMATYNTEIPMLKEAVDSILNQTFGDFEFIIIDDGSTNDSVNYLKSINDERVRVIRNTENVGITKSLNVGLREARGKYIARMDADDISMPERFEIEFSFMEKHPEVIVCGAKIGVIDENGNVTKKASKSKTSEDMESYRVRMLFQNPGPIHPTAFMRHEKLIENHIVYDERLRYAQDYGMWETTSHFGSIVTIEEELLYHRRHGKQITTARREVQMQCDKMTQKKILTALLGDVSDEEVDFHYVHSTGYFPDARISPEVSDWYDRLARANKNRRIYDQGKLEKRILTIKKNLIRQTIKLDRMTGLVRMKFVFRYIPFFPALRTCFGILRHPV